MAIVINGSGTVTGLAVGGLPDGTVDEGTLATDSVTTTKIPASLENTFVSGRKNLIINGAMNVAQRGTSQSSITAGGYHAIDRWRTDVITAGTWTLSQSTDVPTGQGFFNSTKFDNTTADGSLAAGDRVFYGYRIEDQDCIFLKKGTANAVSTTASFWVKSNKTGTYIAELYDSHNSRHINKSYTIDSANTWEKKTITFAGDTSGGFANDNGIGLMLQFWLAAGSNYTSGTLQTSWGGADNTNRATGQVNLADSTSNEWQVTGVQLEVGSVATDFEHRTVGEELALCQRYYQKYGSLAYVGIASGKQFTTTSISTFNFNYPTEMRASPAISFSSLNVTDRASYDLTVSAVTGSIAGKTGVYLKTAHNAGGTAKDATLLAVSSSGTGYLAFDAEL